MKKILAISLLVAVMTLGLSVFSAQARWGVMGGINFSKLENVSFNRGTMTQYHVGATYQAKLPYGFSIQPSLLYSVKGAKLGGVEYASAGVNSDIKVGYIELPVSFQWGPDLLLFRPFIDVTPYIGCGVNNSMTMELATLSAETLEDFWGEDGLKRFEYGVGVGIGLEIWKFQLIGRYIWNLGSLYDLRSEVQNTGVGQAVMNTLENRNFGGFTLTAAILF